MVEDASIHLAQSNSSNFGPINENHVKKCNTEDRKQLFQYKQKFDISYAQYGVVKPLMGGSGYQDKILGGSCKSEVNGVDITILNQKPLLNLLHVSDLNNRGILTRYLYYFYYTTSRRTEHNYPGKLETKKAILADQRLNRALRATIGKNSVETKDNLSDSKMKKTLLQKASKNLDEMIATVTSTALKFCGWLFLTLLRRLTDAVHIHEGQLEILKQILEEDKPIIYFPLHFSHFDYILLSLVMYHNEMRSPFVASGNNLLIQPFSGVMRRVGGFFIRRKIDDGNDKDLIYRALLHSYVSKLLSDGQSVEIFIEGTRSRSGLPNLPRTGLLSVVVDAMRSGAVSDVNLVPVCISYEKILEGTFRTELMGQPKQPETFMSSITSIFKLFFGYYGHIRINFGVPQSLNKTMQELMSSPECGISDQSNFPASSRTSDQSLPDQSITGHELNPGSLALHASEVTLVSYGVTDDEEQTRLLVNILGERIVYNSVKCRVFMSTNLVAFLLIHRWRRGTTLSQLVASFRQLTSDLFSRKSDVGFSGDFRDVVLHALVLLESELVQVDHSSSSMKRCPSNASVRSRKSADSGYDLEDPVDPPSLCKDLGSNPADNKLPHSGSDSGEEMSFSDQEEQLTGAFMAESSPDAIELTPAMANEQYPIQGDHKSLIDSFSSTLKSPKSDSFMFVTPVLEAPQVFDLAYYGNALTPLYALESIVALAVGAVTHFRFSTIEAKLHAVSRGSEVNCVRLDVDEFPESISRSFLRSTLTEKALELSDLLQMDLILCDVAQSVQEATNEAIDRLAARGCFIVEEYGSSASTRRLNAAQELGFNEFPVDSDQWIKVDLEQLPFFISVQSVMSSHVEGYVAAGSKLTSLLLGPLHENDLKRRMLVAAQKRVEDGLAMRNESCSSDIIRNAVRSFEWTGVLERDQLNKKELRLSEKFKNAESIAHLVSRISQFLF